MLKTTLQWVVLVYIIADGYKLLNHYKHLTIQLKCCNVLLLTIS